EVELAAANDRLRALDRLKNTLLHSLSHDLRGPISAILGAATTLGRLGPELSEEERRTLLHTIEVRTRGMQALVSDLLDLERLDRGIAEPKRVPVDAAELARSLVSRCDALRDRCVEVDANAAVVSADRAMLERVIENLVVNAATHTPAESRVWVRVRRTVSGVLLTVEDDGPGVPDDLKATVFEAFRRGPGAAWACRSSAASQSCTAVERGSKTGRGAERRSTCSFPTLSRVRPTTSRDERTFDLVRGPRDGGRVPRGPSPAHPCLRARDGDHRHELPARSEDGSAHRAHAGLTLAHALGPPAATDRLELSEELGPRRSPGGGAPATGEQTLAIGLGGEREEHLA